MSSHHIIKDKQEPALIIANGEACSNSLTEQLLEWNPLVVVLDGAMDRVLELGIKIDVLLGDFDRNRNPEEILKHQSHVKIVRTPDPNKTDLEKGIDYLIENAYPAANIIWATGKRADHSFTNISNLVRYKNSITLVMIDDYSKIFYVKSGFTKHYSKGTPLSLIPIGEATGITTEGLLYNLNHESLKTGYRSGNSNEAAADGIVTIRYESGDLLMMECHD